MFDEWIALEVGCANISEVTSNNMNDNLRSSHFLLPLILFPFYYPVSVT